MKAIQAIVGVLFTVTTLYLILAFLSPKTYRIDRSITIKAPIELIWSRVSDFSQWEEWSPWYALDPRANYTYSEKQEKKMPSMHWVGSKSLSGTGSIVATSISPMKSFQYNLKYTVPYKKTSSGGFLFMETTEGTKVTWYEEGNISFWRSPFMLFYNIDHIIGGDFDKGLSKLNQMLKTEIAKQKEVKPMEIKESIFSSNFYYQLKKKVNTQELNDSTFYENNFEELAQFYVNNNISFIPNTHPTIIYYSWEDSTNTTELATAFVTDTILTLPSGSTIQLKTLKRQKAIKGIYYGERKNLYKAHKKIHTYIRNKSYKTGIVIEEFVTDPNKVKYTSEIITNIYYLLEE